MPSTLMEQLAKAQQARDFPAACRIVGKIFTLTAQTQAQQCRKARAVECDLTFWPACAQRAKQAGAIYQAAQEEAQQRACEIMRRENLAEFADALESGEYAALSF